jgi:hypothetical protein
MVQIASLAFLLAQEETSTPAGWLPLPLPGWMELLLLAVQPQTVKTMQVMMAMRPEEKQPLGAQEPRSHRKPMLLMIHYWEDSKHHE